MKLAHSYEHDSSLYAPCRKIYVYAPFGWIKKAWRDFRRSPLHSLVYGAIFAALGWALMYFSWTNESYFIIGVIISLLIVGPALAFGLYDISHQLERNRKPSFTHERRKAIHEMGHVLMLALLLSLVFLMLVVLISIGVNLISAFGQMAVSAAIPMSDTAFLVVSGIFGVLLFCVSSFALPMIVDRDADAMTAIATSLSAVWRNKAALALWAILVLVLTAIGFATGLLGFVIIVPVLGYATWHAYRETIIS